MKLIALVLCLLSIPTYVVTRAGPEVPMTNPPATISQDKLNQQLTDAILAGSVEEIKKAIAAGADVNHMDSDGKTPVWLALLIGKFDIVVVLLESGAKSNVMYRGKMFPQAFFDKIPGFAGNTYIDMNFAIKGLSLLIQNGVDFSTISGSGLHVSADRKHITDFAYYALLASIEGYPTFRANALELTMVLINHKYDMINKIWDNGDGIFYADKDVVALCLKNGINIDQVVHAQQTNKLSIPMPALFIAVMLQKVSAIETLLFAGANINALANPDGKGMQTPLDFAISRSNSEAIRTLMQRGAKTYKQLQGQ